MTLRRHVDVLFNRLSDHSRRRRRGRPRIKWLDKLRDTPTTHLEIYGGVLFAVVTVLEQRDGRRWLRDSDDDDVYRMGQKLGHYV